jgi:hypothetical protein
MFSILSLVSWLRFISVYSIYMQTYTNSILSFYCKKNYNNLIVQINRLHVIVIIGRYNLYTSELLVSGDAAELTGISL